MIYAFWAILLIVIMLRLYWKHSADSRHDSVREAFFGKKKEKPVDEADFRFPVQAVEVDKERQVNSEAAKAQKMVDDQRARDEAELRKQGFDDDIIAIILPTINNGQ